MPNTSEAMDWVRPYYTKAGDYWGPTGVEQVHLDRLRILEAICGANPKRILELGAGTGEAAAVMADAGHDVVAVEFSTPRVRNLKLLSTAATKGSLTAIEGDCYDIAISGEFDVVCYWDGFGVGSDHDQRRLLRRISREWLKRDGLLLMDVFSPYRWVQETGVEWNLDRNHPSHRLRQRRRFGFDPVNGCFKDTWCPIDDETGQCDEAMAITQKIRCYNPADFQLLLEGTCLTLGAIQVDGEPLDFKSSDVTADHPLWRAWSYLAVVKPTPQ